MEENGELSTYTTVLDAVHGRYMRKEVGTTRMWVWPVRDKPARRAYAPFHGMSMRRLEELGHTARAAHLRWGTYLRQGMCTGPGGRVDLSEDGRHMVVVPAEFKSSMDYDISPFGGYTHIRIRHKTTGKMYHMSSECAFRDNFCYRIGTQKALEHMTAEELEELEQL